MDGPNIHRASRTERERERSRQLAAALAVEEMHAAGLKAARLLEDMGEDYLAHKIRIGQMSVDEVRTTMATEWGE